jgi:hypothetical protein
VTFTLAGGDPEAIQVRHKRRSLAHGIGFRTLLPACSWMMPFGVCWQACSQAAATGGQLVASLDRKPL